MRILAALLVVGACESKPACTPGASVACACTDGSQGAQLCQPDGTFAACVCDGQMTLPPVGPIPDMASPPVTSSGAKRVFVTSTAYVGSALGSACNDAAQAAGLGGSWVAWLSTPTGDAIDNVQGTGPWKLITGQVVFNNHAALGTQPLLSISVTENGTDLSDGYVWTGTSNGGRLSAYNCNGWRDGLGGDYGTIGWTGDDSNWTGYMEQSCNNQNHVYCFER